MYIGDEDDQGGAQNDDDGVIENDEGSKDDFVARNAYENAVSESKKAKARARAAEAKAAKLEADIKAQDEAKLEEEGRWKEIAEAKAKEAEEAKAENLAVRDKFHKQQKIQAVLNALPGKLKQTVYQSHILVDAIGIDDNGQPDAQAVTAEATRFMTDHKDLVQLSSDDDLPNVPAGKGGKPALTMDEYKKLPLEERKKRRREMMELEGDLPN